MDGAVDAIELFLRNASVVDVACDADGMMGNGPNWNALSQLLLLIVPDLVNGWHGLYM